MRTHLSALIAAALLAACAPAGSSAPTLYEYTHEEQARAADELDQLPEDSMILVMMGHYAAVREEIRAMRKIIVPDAG